MYNEQVNIIIVHMGNLRTEIRM